MAAELKKRGRPKKVVEDAAMTMIAAEKTPSAAKPQLSKGTLKAATTINGSATERKNGVTTTLPVEKEKKLGITVIAKKTPSVKTAALKTKPAVEPSPPPSVTRVIRASQ